MTSQQYDWCLTAFFFPCEWRDVAVAVSVLRLDASDALAEVPSNILLKRLSPRVWFPLITVGRHVRRNAPAHPERLPDNRSSSAFAWPAKVSCTALVACLPPVSAWESSRPDCSLVSTI